MLNWTCETNSVCKLLQIVNFDGYSTLMVWHFWQHSSYSTNQWGTTGDSFSYHNGWPFTTPDEDNDSNPDLNCALKNHGGWWFRKCHRVSLNGPYIRGRNSFFGEGVIWGRFKDFRYSLKSSQMKIRPRDFWAAE